MISDNEETVLDDLTLKRRLALSLFTGIWILLSLFFVDFVLSLTLEPQYLYFISTGGGLVAPHTLLEIWDPMMQVVVPVTIVAFVLELTIECMRRNSLQPSSSNGCGELFRAAILSCLVLTTNSSMRLFRYLPFGATALTFLVMLLFYRLSSRLGYKKKASYVRNWIREAWTSSIKMGGAARNILSPVILSTILFEFIMWFPNWEKRLYFSTSSHMSIVLWSIPIILYIVIYYNSIGILINKVITWLKPNSWTGRWVCMGASVVGLLEIGKFYVVDFFTYFALIFGLVASWFISEFINRRQLGILGPVLISRTLGLKAVGKAQFSRNRANITVLIMGIILLSGFAVVPREVIAFQSIELSPVRVAVIDLGVNSDDPWLRHNIVSSKSFVTVENGFKQPEESPQPLSPERIHGTFVAHCITEVFPAVSIVSAKVGNSSGFIQSFRK